MGDLIVIFILGCAAGYFLRDYYAKLDQEAHTNLAEAYNAIRADYTKLVGQIKAKATKL